MKIILIVPHIGRKPSEKYVRTWMMEPLPIATIAGLTPKDVELKFVDERIGEQINFDESADLVGINAEAYTAKRAYEISAEFHKRGIKTIIGGYHAMLMPHEIKKYAHSVMTGSAEDVWEEVIEDCKKGELKREYTPKPLSKINFKLPDRSIFKDKNYLKLKCVETGRGCPFDCEFCSISTATNSKFISKPIDLIIEDIKSTGSKVIFFVDDNIGGDIKHTKELLRRLIPLKIRWISQGSLNMAKDEELLQLLQASGCAGILIGFESLKKESLEKMNKKFMINMMEKNEIEALIKKIHSYNIGIYGTFIFGYETDSIEDFEETVNFAINNKLFIAAFNHLMPFPGTALYNNMKRDGMLVGDPWWLNPEYRFNDIPYITNHIDNAEVREVCLRAREQFYTVSSIFKRAKNHKGNLNSLRKIFSYFSINFMIRKEIKEKNGLPLGNENRWLEELYGI